MIQMNDVETTCVRGWAVARTWFGLSAICASVSLSVTAIFVWLDLYTMPAAEATGPAKMLVLGRLLIPAEAVAVLFSLWLALRIGAPKATSKERRMALALGLLPMLSALGTAGLTVWFFFR